MTQLQHKSRSWWTGYGGTRVFCQFCGHELLVKVRRHPVVEFVAYFWDAGNPDGKHTYECPGCNNRLDALAVSRLPPTQPYRWDTTVTVWHRCRQPVQMLLHDPDDWKGQFRTLGGQDITYCPLCHYRLSRYDMQILAPQSATAPKNWRAALFDLLGTSGKKLAHLLAPQGGTDGLDMEIWGALLADLNFEVDVR